MNLDINQQKLLNFDTKDLTITNKKAICLIAGAGSGKTTTIILKICKMISQGCNPLHFLITTFTRSASKELSERLKKYISSDIVDNMTIGTFHKIASFYLNKYSRNICPISSHDECIVSYSDLISSNEYIEDHRYIFIDEYQDNNLILENIIEKIWNKTAQLLVTIGDDQQNIYTFRQSNINFMLHFKQKYNATEIFLTNNYRCPQSIVETSNYLLENNKLKIDKKFTSANTSNTKILLLPVKMSPYDRTSANKSVAHMIYKKIISIFESNFYNSKKHSICVISRHNYFLKYIEHILSLKRIKSSYISSSNTHILQSEPRIILSTIHATKGLEFNFVLFIDYLPNKNMTSEQIQEERRLYYVATTRTETELTIIYNIDNPSIFLDECIVKKPENFVLNGFIVNGEKENNNTHFKKNKFMSNNVNTIANNITYDGIHLLNNILPFKNCNIVPKQIHYEIPTNNFELDTQEQLITSFDELLPMFVKNYVIRQIHIKKQTKLIALEPLRLLIHEFFGIIQTNQNILSSEIFKKYKINITNHDLNIKNYVLQYGKYAIATSNGSADIKNHSNGFFTNICSTLVPIFTNAYNNFYNYELESENILIDVIYVSIMQLLINNNRPSLQFIKITDSMVDLFKKTTENLNLFLDDEILNGKIIETDVVFSKEITGENMSIFDKIDIIINGDTMINICSAKTPNIVDYLTIFFSKILFNSDCKTCIYSPFSGQIYKYELNFADKKFEERSINEFVNVLYFIQKNA